MLLLFHQVCPEKLLQINYFWPSLNCNGYFQGLLDENNNFFVFHSGGVMIYFDRIEVVNMLVPSAGKSLKGIVHPKV